jgi:RNA polymerase sigma-70 factor (ECF subfamily)
MRLCLMLVNHPATSKPETSALMALMCFHAARFDARIDDEGSIVLLKEQNRKLWNKELIDRGNYYLTKSANGADVSEYHIEAGISFFHSNAERFEDTIWREILRMYDILLTLKSSPVILLNRAIAFSQVEGPEAALKQVTEMQGMEKYYLYHATLGELYLQTGDKIDAALHFQKAMELTSSKAEKELLAVKMGRCG